MTDTRPLEFGLTLDVLRELMTSNRGAIIPHRVGKVILHRIPLWGRTEKDEIRVILARLTDELRERLNSEGLDPDSRDPGITGPLPKRLRNEASWLAALYSYYSAHLDDSEEQLRVVGKGLYWARLSEDRAQEAVLHLLGAWWKLGTEREHEVDDDYRLAIRITSDGKHFPIELDLRSRLVDWLLKTDDVEGAEREAIELLSIASNRTEEDDRRFHSSRALRHLGMAALRKGNLADGIHHLQQALQQATEQTDPIHYSAILYALAGRLNTVGESAKAIELLLEMVEIGKRSQREVISTNAFGRMGEIYLELHDIERAREAFELAERFVSNINLPNVYQHIRYRKLPLYLITDQTEEGIAGCRELLEFYSSGPLHIHILGILGQLYEKHGALDKAEEVLRTGYKQLLSTDGSLLTLSIPLGRVLIALQRTEEAREILQLACTTEPDSKAHRENRLEGFVILSRLARNAGRYPEAFDWMEKADEARAEIQRLENEETLRNTRIISDIRMREHEEELARVRLEHATKELAGILTGVQMTHGTLLRVETGLRQELSWLQPEQIERVVAALRQVIVDPSTVEAVSMVASEAESIAALHGVDRSFFEALEQRWPELTRKQKQLCGLIRAGLQTPQVVQLLGITPNGVWTQRKRLRKRLGLEPGESLEEVLMNIKK